MPFGLDDVFAVLLFKIDAVILSLMATNAAVGRYGTAYRLFEATLFITYSLGGAFSAMYTYLGDHTEPTVQGVYQRSIKLALVLLLPIAVGFAVLAEPLTTFLFGDDFAAAADPLRVLAPAVVLLAVVNLSSGLVVSRSDPRRIVRVGAFLLLFNIGLNIALIPALADSGAALAMLVTEVVAVGVVVTMASRTIGLDARWLRTLLGPLAAAALTAGAMLALAGVPLVALGTGALVYAVALLLLELALSPGDVRFVADMARRRFPRAPFAGAGR